MAWQREIALHDDASKTKGAERRGKAEGRAEGQAEKSREIAKNLIGMSIPIEQIEKATGLTREEIEKLQ
jgi:predicted transposase/invertase (TIGR01784 family)